MPCFPECLAGLERGFSLGRDLDKVFIIRVIDADVFIVYFIIMTSLLHPIAGVELFHLLFLDQLGRKLDKRHYALKGGCNLRFYLQSIRYSEDMDIDVESIPVELLRERVGQILSGGALARILQARGLRMAQYSAPKQTETTQRWKLTLVAQGAARPLPTKIEFSRRGLDQPVAFGPVDQALMREYQLTPLLASHYPAETAFRQKVQALIHRTQPQARDLFDLAHLLRSGVSTQEMARPPQWPEAQQKALSITYDIFKSQVLAFLAPEYQAQYDDPQVWDELVLGVVEAL